MCFGFILYPLPTKGLAKCFVVLCILFMDILFMVVYCVIIDGMFLTEIIYFNDADHENLPFIKKNKHLSLSHSHIKYLIPFIRVTSLYFFIGQSAS